MVSGPEQKRTHSTNKQANRGQRTTALKENAFTEIYLRTGGPMKALEIAFDVLHVIVMFAVRKASAS